MIHTANVIECILHMPSIILGLGQNKMGKEKKQDKSWCPNGVYILEEETHNKK